MSFLGYKYVRINKQFITCKHLGLLRIKYIAVDGFIVYGAHKKNPLISETIPFNLVMNKDLTDKNIEVLFGGI